MARKGQQYSASGRLAAGAVCVTLCLLAAHTAFISGPVSGPKSLRGTPASSSPQFESWAAAGALQAGSETTGRSAVAPQFQAAALAAVLALVAGLVPVSPARAQEAAAPVAEKVTEASNYVATKQKLDAAKKEETELKSQAPEKEERLKRQIEQMKKEEGGDTNFAVNRGRESKKENTKRRKVKEVQEKKPGSGFSFALPSLSLPSFSVPEDTSGPVKKKVFISPADELDEDELPLSRENRPLLVLILLFPSAVYIFFWVAGSLDII
ncbi:unnamed protein product [Polarella glacialis]|uniref:Transmembrane protein n=1 Tax=Polarella glacialis TaxID=89957 RepID=A0A813GTQ3_POLGL|nr:unnamed protein product [Polarella glacialis]CAE8627925.1 unnamed protein product [Polarella glacialis]